MKISLTDAGKRFNRDWIFRHFTYSFDSGSRYAIIGPNGSGKSTLLQCLAGNMMLSEGNVKFENGSGKYKDEIIFQKVSICAPYLDLVEEMTFREFLDFHEGFKPYITSVSKNEIIDIVGLKDAENKQIRYYSSGMKQRVKLSQAVFSDSEVILLDEPCTNLDSKGIDLYLGLIDKYCNGRLVIVSSNDETEYGFCQQRINMTAIKGNGL